MLITTHCFWLKKSVSLNMKTYHVKLVLTEIKDNDKEEAVTEVEIVEARDIAEAEKVMERILWNVHH